MGMDAPTVEETTLKILNIPNLLSLSRILSVPVFILLMLEPNPARALAAGIVFSLASATDWLDGYLARKWGQVTKIGKLLDPIADKILIMSALVILVEIRSDVVSCLDRHRHHRPGIRGDRSARHGCGRRDHHTCGNGRQI